MRGSRGLGAPVPLPVLVLVAVAVRIPPRALLLRPILVLLLLRCMRELLGCLLLWRLLLLVCEELCSGARLKSRMATKTIETDHGFA
jgi:hypothetical protein